MSEPSMRLDKWLWVARFAKSRTLATALCTEGRLRINGRPTTKPHAAVRPGDVLVFAHPSGVRSIEIVACAPRRVGAAEARKLYTDLAVEAVPATAENGRG